MNDVDTLRKIKRLIIIAFVSDDDLMDTLVLKGGNALDLIYEVNQRSSIDIDFSMEDEFSHDELNELERRIQNLLEDTFSQSGFCVFDVILSKKPPEVSEDLSSFWGGYEIEFKVINEETAQELNNDLNAMQRQAVEIGAGQKRKFKVQISKFECCQPRLEMEIEDYTVYVYALELIMFEKLRAICQSMPEYRQIVKSHPTSRTRDFFDIYSILQKFKIDPYSSENLELLRNVFKAKKVPLDLLDNIESVRESNRLGFESLKDTVYNKDKLKSYDFYFDYVAKLGKQLFHTLREI